MFFLGLVLGNEEWEFGRTTDSLEQTDKFWFGLVQLT